MIKTHKFSSRCIDIAYIESVYPYNIYVREDIKGIDYIFAVAHELVHKMVFKMLLPKKIKNILHLIFDVYYVVLICWDMSAVKEYYLEYKQCNTGDMWQ